MRIVAQATLLKIEFDFQKEHTFIRNEIYNGTDIQVFLWSKKLWRFIKGADQNK
ncbi:MAG: hypothetical protein CM15mV25_1690 [uncultured marine virus]|nr:MAG: hypothetical protein CM15mV25_1690 [uncultured marine virus]